MIGDVADAGSVFDDLADLPVVDGVFFGIAAVLLVVLFVLLMAVVVVTLLIAVAELGVLLAVAALAVAGRVVLRHPWTVEAHADDGTTLRWNVVGWRASRAHRTAIATTLAAGATPNPATRSDAGRPTGGVGTEAGPLRRDGRAFG